MSEEPDVVVIGGGLAGITTALDCAQGGAKVTLLEVRRRLGGAAYSFVRDGLELDNGQHVFLRCCEAYRGLLRRLGSEQLVSVQPRLEIPVLKPGAARVLLRRSSLPAPLHLAGALARYPYLARRERLGAARATLALMRLLRSRAGRRERALDRVTFGAWLARHGQGPQALASLWDLIALPTLNLPATEASLALGAFVFEHGLLSEADAGDIGFHRGTLGATIGEPATRVLADAGVDVRLGWRAQRLACEGDGFIVHGRAGGFPPGAGEEPGEEDGPASDGGPDGHGLRGGESAGQASEQPLVRAGAVVVAIPHGRAAGLLEPLLGEPARQLTKLGSSPIVNLHVVFDRPVCGDGFAAGVETPVQYLFDRTAAAGAPPGCQYLAVSLSGAEREMRMSVEALRERYLAALRELLPRSRGARVERFHVTREHAATFRAAPGVEALRPGPRTSVPGLVLAGAWTATGWPATLEGAVLSGHAAAVVALEGLT